MKRVAWTLRVPKELHDQMVRLAGEVTAREGKRISVNALYEVAIRNYLTRIEAGKRAVARMKEGKKA